MSAHRQSNLRPGARTALERGAVQGCARARQIDALVMQNTNDWLGGHVKWFTDVPAS